MVQTVEQEPATVLDAQSTALINNELLDGSVFYTQRELEKKLWRRHQDRFLREKKMIIEHSAKNNVSSLDLSSGVHISGLDHGGLVNIDNREEEGNSDESDRLERNSNDSVLEDMMMETSSLMLPSCNTVK